MVDPSISVKSLRTVVPPCYVSDHWAVKLQVHSAGMQAHRRYLHNCSRLPTVHPEPDEHGPNMLFSQLLDHHSPPTPTIYLPQDAWIVNDTWALIDCRNAALHCVVPQEELRPLRKAIRKKIKRDRALCLKTTRTEIETHLDADDPREAWHLVKVWYRKNTKAQPPTPADLNAIGNKFRELYAPQPSPGDPLRGMVTFNIPDHILDQAEILAAANTLCPGCAPE